MAITLVSKAPSERVDYIWTPAIDAGDTIAGSAVVTRVGGTAVLDSVTVETGNLTVKLWFTLGADGETSEFLGTVNTVGGRVWQESFYLPVNNTSYGPLGATLVRLWPVFAAAPAATVDYWLERASVQAAWADGHGQMLYAAHNLSLSGYGAGAIPAGLTSFKSGAFSATISDKLAGATGFDATVWGREFRALMFLQTGTPRLVTGGGIVDADSYYVQ